MKKILFVLLFASAISYASNEEPFNHNLRGLIIVSHPDRKLVEQPEYINSDEERYVRFLLNVKDKAPAEIKQFSSSKDIEDTHLKSSYNDIKLSIPFKPLNESNNIYKNINIVGYAAGGSYKDGWDGIKVFFNDNTLSACAYSKNKILAIQMEKEKIQYIVNNKPSFKVIMGNYEGGFINNVSWYTDKKTYVFQEQIDCATRKLDKNMLDKMVVLANQIDKSN